MVSTQVNIPGYQVRTEFYNASRTLVYRAVREMNIFLVGSPLVMEYFGVISL